jgi:hypothetical protein
MEIKPVKKTEPPQYPIKEDVTAEQIKAQVPKRWQDNKAAKLALGALAAMTLGGCEAPPLAGVPMPPETSIPVESPNPSDTQIIEGIIMGEVMAPTIMVAPLFAHGNGRGAFGCDMVTPPVFLSEAEALEVINEAAIQYGLEFSAGQNIAIADVLEPITCIVGEVEEPVENYISLKPDFADIQHGIAIEFVSVDDVKRWNQGPEEAIVASYDTMDAAQQLSDALADAYNTIDNVNTAGVLYDPCETAALSAEQISQMFDEQTREIYEQQIRALSEQQLKKQAIDFFEWLREQGVI